MKVGRGTIAIGREATRSCAIIRVSEFFLIASRICISIPSCFHCDENWITVFVATTLGFADEPNLGPRLCRK